MFFGKIDLFTPSLGDKEAIIPCRFDCDLKKKKKKICPPTPTPKKVVEDNQTIIFWGGGLICIQFWSKLV